MVPSLIVLHALAWQEGGGCLGGWALREEGSTDGGGGVEEAVPEEDGEVGRQTHLTHCDYYLRICCDPI